MDDQNRNLLLAMVLSTMVLFAWYAMFPPAEQVPPEVAGTTAEVDPTALSPSAGAETSEAAPTTETDAGDATKTARATIETPSLAGSVSATGARIDALELSSYDVSVDSDENVVLLAPLGSDQPYFATFGWLPQNGLDRDEAPGSDAVWEFEDGARLTPSTPLEMTWESPSGLVFRQTVSVDDRFMFTIEQSVENPTDAAVSLAPYGMIARYGEPRNLSGFWVIHEGAIRMTDGIFESYDFGYGDMRDLRLDESWQGRADVAEVTESGWVGFTDHYWMTALIPERGTPFLSVVEYVAEADVYRTVARQTAVEVAAGATASRTTRLFAGAKEWEAIRDYEAGRDIEGFGDALSYAFFGEENGVPGLTEAIEWGWYAFLTKPIFFVLHELNALIGNMGWAIIGLTLLIKALLFPLARKSYVSMAKMKELQPEMEKIKERAGDDRQKLQQEMMALYKNEKVNPASGCLPILLQIPIFFSLYKVIFVTLELRHAEWFGPFRDLSAPDPTSIFNFFGLMPWALPFAPDDLLGLLFIGILPLLLGISMWLQQKLNPAPTDPTQAMIFAWMPWVFMFMLGSFASGLVIYWIANNVITFVQQYTIMRSHGYRPDIWGNIRGKPNGEAPKAANSGKPPKPKK